MHARKLYTKAIRKINPATQVGSVKYFMGKIEKTNVKGVSSIDHIITINNIKGGIHP